MPNSPAKIAPDRVHWGLPAACLISKAARPALFIFIVLLAAWGGLLTAGWLQGSAAFAAAPASSAGEPPGGSPADVQGNWAAAEISKAIAAGYAKGYPGGMFRPNAAVTRAEFATMVDLAFQLTTVQGGSHFRDVTPGDWFSSSVDTAAANGFVKGYPDGTFRPQREVNRQEASCMLAQVLQLSDGNLNFPDAGSISGWAKPFVAGLEAQGIISGYPDGTMRPDQVISRAEAVVLINKALASLAGARADETGGNVQNGSGTPGAQPSRSQAVVLNVGVGQDQNGVEVEIAVNQEVYCQLTEQQTPQRLLVTVPGITVVRSPLEIDVGAGGLDKVTTSWSDSSGTAQIEISFADWAPLLTYYKSPEQPGGILITVPPQIYKIDAYPVSDFLTVNIWATSALNYQASSSPQPSQIDFTFPGFSLSPGLQGWRQQFAVDGVNSLQLSEPQAAMAGLVAQTQSDTVYSADSSSDVRELVLRIQEGAGTQGVPVAQGNLHENCIVLDPGHGGDDSGAIGPYGVEEKWVTLAIATKTAEILRQQGYDVIMTRDGDTNPDLYSRPEVANQNSAAVFVSIHANWISNPSIGGTGTYTYAPPGTPLGQQRGARLRLANDLQNALLASIGLHNCGIFEDRFAVLRCCDVPAALVEVAFLSNPHEERLLNQSSFQQQAAAGIASGITGFLSGG